MTIKEQYFEIKDEQQFINSFNNYLESLDKSSNKYIDLVTTLASIGYFEDVKIYINQIIKEMDSIQKENNIEYIIIPDYETENLEIQSSKNRK